ncbi:hypothetical protein Pmani_011901 [Petrolisthes manimaculis]|uniref:Uncharacterized protein n=1 Tax=Petrolisthes manimaculis TaxID=1843537 RepID=A0AAE1UF76_9EUCA|nr:hypothetical protein Pmani_011901 [Petrolisthes manimaculis]
MPCLYSTLYTSCLFTTHYTLPLHLIHLLPLHHILHLAPSPHFTPCLCTTLYTLPHYHTLHLASPYNSHLDIRDAILTLEKSIKDVTNKLLRHEAREFQASELAKKVMQTLVIKQDQGERNMQAVARQLVSMEERILSIEALIQTVRCEYIEYIDSSTSSFSKFHFN